MTRTRDENARDAMDAEHTAWIASAIINANPELVPAFQDISFPDWLRFCDAAAPDILADVLASGLIAEGLRDLHEAACQVAQSRQEHGRVAYHLTPAANLGSILENGLVPDIGERASALDEVGPAVYLFASIEDLEDAHWIEDAFDDEPLCLLEVDVTGLDVWPSFDNPRFWEMSVRDTISTDRLRVMATDIDKVASLRSCWPMALCRVALSGSEPAP